VRRPATPSKKKTTELSVNLHLDDVANGGGSVEFTDAATGLLYRFLTDPSRLCRASMARLLTSKETGGLLPHGLEGETYARWKARLDLLRLEGMGKPPRLSSIKGTKWKHSCHLHDCVMPTTTTA
jgi:hypothetical protein